MIIYIDTPLDEPLRDKLVNAAAGDRCIFKADLAGEAEQLAAIIQSEVIFGNPRPASMLQQAVNLKWIQLYSAGFEYYRHLEMQATVTNMKDYFSEPCAETAIAGILAIYRGMDRFALLKIEKKWIGYGVRSGLQVLAGKQVLILGSGNIGQRLAAILNGFGCAYTFYARSPGKNIINSPVALSNAIPGADIIICCLPGTAETTGLFTRQMVISMKPGAIFCNVGRGKLVADENALADALMTGRIGGAVLDVTADEPLPPGHPFWDCPNTILSQHSGGGMASEYDGLLDFFLSNLERYKAGLQLENRVQLNRGY